MSLPALHLSPDDEKVTYLRTLAALVRPFVPHAADELEAFRPTSHVVDD